MKLSLNWIQDYIDLSGIDVKDLVSRLTLATCEVEEVVPAFAGIADIVFAEIVSTEKHPQADKLQLCQIRAGQFEGKIVCGAPNARAGILVPFAPVGATIPGKDGNGMTISHAKIRGVESAGMLCSAFELGLEAIFSGDGLIEFQEIAGGHKPGDALTSMIPADYVLTIDNKSITNRPDLWCHFGFAREISAIYRRKLKFDPLTVKPKLKTAKLSKKIKIEPGAALGYFGAVCQKTRVMQTPLWMRLRLASVGRKKSINNIVDVSNYVMLELGQPNHLFDLSTLRDDTVTVGLSDVHNIKSFKTLDGETREIPANSILILDGAGKSARAVALGGVMGGEDSAIQPETKELFIESATFPRELIRRTLKKVDLRTDSAMRFEKGQDPAKAKPAIIRIASLLEETCPDIAMGPITGTSASARKSKMKVSLSFLQNRLGFAIGRKEVETTLEWLGFSLTSDKSGKIFSITAPTYRSQYDITIPEDIVEELGRIHGYDHIAPIPAVAPVVGKSLDHTRLLDRRLRRFLADRGFTETLSYSFCTREDNQVYGVDGVALKNHMAGLTHLKAGLIPATLRHLAVNQDRFPEVNLFDAARAYASELSLEPAKTHFLHAAGPAREEKRICVARLLPEKLDLAAQEDELVGFRAMLRELCELAGKRTVVSSKSDADWGPLSARARIFHPAGSLLLTIDKTTIGILGLVHPGLIGAYGLKRSVLIAEISFDRLAGMQTLRAYSPPSIYPDSLFELTVVLEADRSAQEPINVIDSLNFAEIHSINLLGVYRGTPIPDGKKAVSYRIRCRKADGTFASDEWKKIWETSIAALEKVGMPIRK